MWTLSIAFPCPRQSRAATAKEEGVHVRAEEPFALPKRDRPDRANALEGRRANRKVSRCFLLRQQSGRYGGPVLHLGPIASSERNGSEKNRERGSNSSVLQNS